MSEIHPLLRKRRSSRLYDPDRPVAPDAIASLLEAARWAPSGGNRQPWRYIVFDDRVPQARDLARSCLDESNRVWATAAPVLIAAVSRDLRDNGQPNAKSQHDLGLANMSLMLQAISLGLNCRPIGGFDADKARRLFAIPEDHTPTVMIAIGYPGRLDQATQEIQAREASTRERQPVESIAFYGGWGRERP